MTNVDDLIELVLGLLLAVAALAHLANRIRIAYPILLVVAGVVIAALPGLPKVELDPAVVFLVFLPPILYQAALQTTWRDFVANIRPISLLAVGLVLFSTVAIALVIKWLVPAMPWGAAFVLGAIVSPPDAASAAAIARGLSVPKRIVTILEGESLVNDASALVLYKFAIAATLAGTFSAASPGDYADAVVSFLFVAVFGIAVGVIVGGSMAWVRSKIDDPTVEGLIHLLVPYMAFIPCEHLGVSGVLSAVAAGIVMNRLEPSIISYRARLRSYGVWDLLIFLLNGLIFILIGLQLSDVVTRLQNPDSDLGAVSISRLYWWALAVSLTAIVSRIIWVYPMAYLSKFLPYANHAEPPPPLKHVTVVAWTGMRGIVSLAAALALPVAAEGKTEFPFRDLIIFLTFAVILATLVLQGLTLPALIRLLRLSDDNGVDANREEREARIEAAHAALSRLEVLAFDGTINPDLIARIRAPYDQRIQRLGGQPHESILMPGIDPIDPDGIAGRIRREALIAERRMVTFLRDQNVIGDEVLRKLIREIDLEEAKLGD